jgi:signal transduction histidine kinase
MPWYPRIVSEAIEDRRRDALIQAGLALASELSLPALLQKIVALACTVADARYGALGVLSRDGTRLDDFITHGVTQDERDAIGDLPVGHGILGVLIMEGETLRLRRIVDHPLSVGFPPNHPQMVSFLGVPLRVRDKVYGNLYLTEKRGAEEFTEEDERAVVTLAAQAGIAIENARLHEEIRRLAVLEDRERIAKDLHDGVVQSLFAVGMALQAGQEMVNDPKAIGQRLQESVGHIDDVIRDLRNYIFGLGPSGKADRQLDAALNDLADEFRRGSDVAIRVEVEPVAASVASHHAAELIQVAREAISNAVRHGDPRTLSVVLNTDGDHVVLEVEDDGHGFDPDSSPEGGRGLAGLRERAAALGGTLEIRSSTDGTTVRARVPT